MDLTLIVMSHFSIGIGWQNGIISDVFFTAITPATIAVEKTGPFLPIISDVVRSSFNVNSFATLDGRSTLPYNTT